MQSAQGVTTEWLQAFADAWNRHDAAVTTFQDFEQQARNDGYEEVVERTRAQNTTLETHAHPFAVKALVVRGEMWLTVGESIRRLLPGDAFELARDVPHAERYGAEGAMYWVARRR